MLRYELILNRHKIIFELEKKKMIEEKKEYKEIRNRRNRETRNMLESIENAYKGKINILGDRLRRERVE